MASLRLLRVRELLKREIGEIIRRELPLSETGLITVNDIGISKDLHTATVFVGIVGTEHQQQAGLATLRRERVKIQAILGRAIVLKYTPQLRFVLDESVERGNRVLEILDEIEKTDPPHEDPLQDH